MMVKHTETASPLKVSMKAHREVFTPSNFIVDAIGTEKICVNEESARKMFHYCGSKVHSVYTMMR